VSDAPAPRARAARQSLSDALREELARIVVTSDCDRLAELSGLFHAAGRLHLRGRGAVAVHLDVGGSAVARRAFRVLSDLGVSSELRTYRQRSFAKPTRYQVHVEGGARALAVLRRAGVVGRGLTPVERPPRHVVRRSCCRRAYLRGALLGAGSVTGPAEPHLEIRMGGFQGAAFLAEIAERESVTLRVLDRGRHAAAYAKGAQTIADALAAVGASDSVLVFEERAVLGATRSRANRLTNADHANLVRAAEAAYRHVQAARRLERSGRLATLSPAVREAVELRLRHPSLSLRDLARKCRPQVTKATLHRRLRRVVEVADAEDAGRNVQP
jgi:DNA-binding protein WhiA